MRENLKKANTNKVVEDLIESISNITDANITDLRNEVIQTITGEVIEVKGSGMSALAKIKIGSRADKNIFDDIPIGTHKSISVGDIVLCEYYGNNMANLVLTQVIKKNGEFIEQSGGSGGGGGSPFTKYTQTFSSTSGSWKNANAPFKITIEASTHRKGVNPTVDIHALINGAYQSVLVRKEFASNGDMTLYSNAKKDIKVIIY